MSDISALKKEYVDIFKKNISREGSEDLLEWLEHADFFTAPASSRFHGAYDGGLLEHSLNVYHCLLKELDLEGIRDKYSEETIAIVALLHDICKVNFYKKGTRNVKKDGVWVAVDTYNIEEKFPCGHGEKSVIIIQNFMHLDIDEIYAIRAHMGGFDMSAKGGAYFIGDIFDKSRLALLLHVADMKATHLLESVNE